jgi:cysteine-rich repeat protein
MCEEHAKSSSIPASRPQGVESRRLLYHHGVVLRARSAHVIVAVAAGTWSGCGDLLHSTAWRNECDIDRAACETGGAGGGDSGAGGSGAGASGAGAGSASSTGSGAVGSSASVSSGSGGSSGCGDGTIDAGEECDDGNGVAGDGCDDCMVVCTGSFETKDTTTAHCYRADPMATATWDAARAACQAWGGDLAAIGSAAENALVAGLIQTSSWIGATDAAVEGAFGWSSGELWMYTNWALGEPNDSAGEDCTELYGPETTLPAQWNDLLCTTALPAVCERPPPGN